LTGNVVQLNKTERISWAEKAPKCGRKIMRETPKSVGKSSDEVKVERFMK
jgi:hypothetical protein